MESEQCILHRQLR